MRPDVKVIGVQALSVPSMFTSVANDEITTIKDHPTNADGIHVLTPGNEWISTVPQFSF